MSLPVDVGMIANEIPTVASFDAKDTVEALIQSMDPGSYAQIAERRSQLEDAETLRRVRAL